MILRHFMYKGSKCRLESAEYQDGNPALIVMYYEDGMREWFQYAKLSVNIPGTELAPNEALIKTWSENVDLCAFLLNELKMFTDTGRRIPTGFVTASVWSYS